MPIEREFETTPMGVPAPDAYGQLEGAHLSIYSGQDAKGDTVASSISVEGMLCWYFSKAVAIDETSKPFASRRVNIDISIGDFTEEARMAFAAALTADDPSKALGAAFDAIVDPILKAQPALD